jgi:hypothetical protein
LLQTHPNGISAELRTVDNHIVSVKMQEPLQEPLSGLVEFHGTVQGKNTVLSDFYLSFPPEFTKNFGMFSIASLQISCSFSKNIFAREFLYVVVMLCIMTFLRLNLSWQTSYSE